MTQAEFAKGWKLLILQPWGWRYRSMTEQGGMTEETKTQMEFYYDKLKWAQGEAWRKVASGYAEGDRWPSLSDLRQSLSIINRHFVKAIAETSTQDRVPMPDDVRQMLAKLGVRQKDLTDISLHPIKDRDQAAG